MHKSGFILLSIMLAACESGPFSAKRDLDASSKQDGTVISCSGYKAWQDCDRAAAQACPKGYEVLNKEENIAVQARSLRISCK
jgi:hypothetical protein